MSRVSQIAVGPDEGGMRVDRWFQARYPTLGHGHLQKLLRTGQVRVDGKRVKANARLEAGQTIRVPPIAGGGSGTDKKPSAPRSLNAADRALLHDARLYEDESLLVLNKPAGLAVQGGSKTVRHIDGMLMALEPETGARWRLVHRLDRETSGVLLIAKTRQAAAELGKAFQTRSVLKVYWAVTLGVPKPLQGRIDLPLIKAQGPGGETIRPAQEHERKAADLAVTHYNVVDQAGSKLAWVTLKPSTGRQHQLRVHLAALGTPIAGDDKYGGDREMPASLDSRLHLHARRVSFAHPITGDKVDVTAPLPAHMTESFAFLGFAADHTVDDA
ncbi:MAG: RluA family pseudouridine synthase [Pseudomonadota bacterium]